MARIRTIKPGFWKHEDLSELPPETHMLAAALLNYSDDEGYFNANIKLIKAECCPLREDSTSIQRGLEQLSKVGYLRLGKSADGKSYGHVINFLEHQKVDRPTASKIKALSIIWEGSSNIQRELDEGSSPERKGKEVNSRTKIVLHSDGSFEGLEANIEVWKNAFPNVDVDTQIRKAGSWIISNPKRAPKSNYPRFLNNWLSRSSENASSDDDIFAGAK